MENEVVETGTEEVTEEVVDNTGSSEQSETVESETEKKDEGKGEEKAEDLESVKTERDTANKRLSDKDSHITTLERENATLRKSKKAESTDENGLSAKYPKESAEIAQLRLDGKELEADELSAQVRVKVYEDRISKENDARMAIINGSQNKNDYRDFDKYKEAVEAGLKDIPLSELSKNPDKWVKKEYEAAVGADYLSLKGGSKKTGKIDAGGGASTIDGSSGSGEKNESEKITDAIAVSFPKEGI